MKDQKAAIVTGGASGIGQATVERLVRDGWAVVIGDVNEEAGEALAKAIRAANGQALFVRTDVRDEAAVETLVRRTVEAFGHLDGAVNSAGVPQSGSPIYDMSEADWNLCNDVNLRGMFFCLKHQIRAMWPNAHGAIVAVSSPAGVKALANSAAYCASKAGVNGLVRAAALDCAERNIRINALMPGATLTPLAQKAIASAPLLSAKKLWPMDRWGTPEEMGAAAVWMISDDASFMTGACMAVDGGMTAA